MVPPSHELLWFKSPIPTGIWLGKHPPWYPNPDVFRRQMHPGWVCGTARDTQTHHPWISSAVTKDSTRSRLEQGQSLAGMTLAEHKGGSRPWYCSGHEGPSLFLPLSLPIISSSKSRTEPALGESHRNRRNRLEVERAGAGESCLCSSANTTQVMGGVGAALMLETKPGQRGSARTGIPGVVEVPGRAVTPLQVSCPTEGTAR